jgi:hypothetical protein
MQKWQRTKHPLKTNPHPKILVYTTTFYTSQQFEQSAFPHLYVPSTPEGPKTPV